MEIYLVVQTLGFAIGVVLFGLLVILSRKAEKQMRGAWSGTWAAWAGWVWNAANLCEQIAVLSGLGAESLLHRFANVLAWCAAAVLPMTLLLLLRPLVGREIWNARRSRWLFRFSCATAAGLSIGLSLALLNESIGAYFFRLQQGTAYNFLAHALVATVVFRDTRQGPSATRRYSVTMLLLLAGLGIGALLALHVKLNPTAAMLLDIAIRQSSIPMALATFVFLARFRLADVFVKRSLTVLTATALVFAYGLLVVEPVARMARESSSYPNAGAWFVGTVLWCFILLLFPAADRLLRRVADRWIFRRPDYRQLLHRFLRESESVESEAELFALADEKIRTALGASSTRFIPYDPALSLAEWMKPVADDVIQLPPGDPARKLLGDPEPEVLLPIEVNAQIEQILAVTPGEQGRKLLTEEIQFLLDLAERIARKMESIEFERERRKQTVRESSLKQLLAEAELKALRAQVNPHFLFNTLNTIMDLIGSDPEKAETMTERLAEVFRYVLNLTDRSSITMKEEVEFLRTYLEIEHARFGNRLKMEISMDPRTTNVDIPPLILQPLVENSIRHGLAPKSGGGTIRISTQEQGSAVRIILEDDGIGFRDGLEWRSFSSGKIGLRNVWERLRTFYGDRAEMTVQSQPGSGTKVSLTLPRGLSSVPGPITIEK